MTEKIRYELTPSKTVKGLFSCERIRRQESYNYKRVRRGGFLGFLWPKKEVSYKYKYDEHRTYLVDNKWSRDYWENAEVLYLQEKEWRKLIRKWEEARRWYNNTKPIEICSCCCSKDD